MKKMVCLLLCAGMLQGASAQALTENVVLVTLDGMRWQEVFKGVDTVILNEPRYTRGRKGLAEMFDAGSATSRQKLMPFLWSVVAKEGVLLGNRALGSQVNNANPHWFSYPGYNELLTGYPDPAVNSNDKRYNQHVTVLEALNKQPAFAGKVAAFATWDVFPFIINSPRSGVLVNAGMDSFPLVSPAMAVLNDMQAVAPQPIGVRPDVITYFAAREYLLARQPRVLYIAFDETDDYAHAGLYNEYLRAAHAEDQMLANLWNLLQQLPQYKGKTTLIVTTDHGRGDAVKDQWRDHGTKVPDASEVWIAAIGPGIKALGEASNTGQQQQGQVAATIARLLGLPYQPAHPVLPALQVVLAQ